MGGEGAALEGEGTGPCFCWTPAGTAVISSFCLTVAVGRRQPLAGAGGDMGVIRVVLKVQAESTEVSDVAACSRAISCGDGQKRLEVTGTQVKESGGPKPSRSQGRGGVAGAWPHPTGSPASKRIRQGLPCSSLP